MDLESGDIVAWICTRIVHICEKQLRFCRRRPLDIAHNPENMEISHIVHW